MGDVIDLDCETTLDIPVEKVLKSAEDLDMVIVIGWSGDNFYFATSSPSRPEINILLDIAKQSLMDALR